jgi:predicted O-methyltransferase YrrM
VNDETILDLIIKERPQFHDSGSICYGLSAQTLRALWELAKPDSRTIETGAGLSTIVLAARGCNHTCITPSSDEVARIKQFCADHQIDVSRVTFMMSRSEDVVPGFSRGSFGLVLIDGRHGFPTPFIDWFYLGRALKMGGHLVIDDTQLFTVRLLVKFLSSDPDWRFVREYDYRTGVFQKTGNSYLNKEWCAQPFVTRYSRFSILRYNLRKKIGSVCRRILGLAS